MEIFFLSRVVQTRRRSALLLNSLSVNGEMQTNANHCDLNATECALAQARELRISDNKTIQAMAAQVQLDKKVSRTVSHN